MGSRSPDADAPLRWVPLRDLSALARSLLGKDLGGRDAVPGHVADRVTALAAQWTDHGFTNETMQPWADLTPACAAYLASRRVNPATLDQLIDVPSLPKPVTLRRAISSGHVDAEQAYNLLVSSGKHSPQAPPRAAAGDTTPPESPATPPSPAPAVFSHPNPEHDETDYRPRSQPSHTPFHP